MKLPSCPSCLAPIPADAPGGICPSCALLGVVQPTGPAPLGETPAMDEVAAAFPDLEILGVIGQGGMGVVYQARQLRLDRLVALKILPPHLARQPGFAERFTREARALARLNHPHIVAVYDFGESGGFFYLVMEYVDGVNLRQAMRSGIKPEQAMLLVPRICEALQFAHDRGVLHRDIKPENILLDRSGTPKLADFGIAKFSGDAPGNLTLSGAALGTAAYMAPEQVEKPATVDHRADIYSLGVVFYEMLTGELPLGRFDAPSAKAAVGEGVDAVVMRALEKERERRQQSAGELKTQVEGVRTGNPPQLRRPRHHDRSGLQRFLLALCMLSGAMIPVSGMLHLSVRSDTFVAGTILFGVLFAIAGVFRRHDKDFPELRVAPEELQTATAVMGHPAYPRIARQPFESISRRRLLGLPLYHIVRGPNPATGRTPTARGFFALGPAAVGVFALGGRAFGFFALGGLSCGVVTVGGMSLGMFAAGGFAAGLMVAAGGFALAPLALGGSAIGLVGIGGASLALECLAGQKYYPGSAPLGPLYHHVLTVTGAAGGITLVLAMVLLQLSFFAREPEPGAIQRRRSGTWLGTAINFYLLCGLAAIGWLVAEQVLPRISGIYSKASPQPAFVEVNQAMNITSGDGGVISFHPHSPVSGTVAVEFDGRILTGPFFQSGRLPYIGSEQWAATVQVNLAPSKNKAATTLRIILPPPPGKEGHSPPPQLELEWGIPYSVIAEGWPPRQPASQSFTLRFDEWRTATTIAGTPLRLGVFHSPPVTDLLSQPQVSTNGRPLSDFLPDLRSTHAPEDYRHMGSVVISEAGGRQVSLSLNTLKNDTASTEVEPAFRFSLASGHHGRLRFSFYVPAHPADATAAGEFLVIAEDAKTSALIHQVKGHLPPGPLLWERDDMYRNTYEVPGGIAQSSRCILKAREVPAGGQPVQTWWKVLMAVDLRTAPPASEPSTVLIPAN